MLDVGLTNRQGWLDEPKCQSCHTGTATSNNGQIRYTSVFDANGAVRQAVNATFATTPNVPSTGHSLYRFSTGHGGLQCSACHGSPHAEYPSLETNDNLQVQNLQGHAGVLAECSACHTTVPSRVSGGPHGMHPIGQAWVSAHSDAVEQTGTSLCSPCHGQDYRGTVLSRAQADRTLTTHFGTKQIWRGFQIGCYLCHQGPGSESASRNSPATASSVTASTTAGIPVPLALIAADTDGDTLTLRIVSQALHGTVRLTNRQATYFPAAGFVGNDSFTFAAWDGAADSNLGTGKVSVTPGAPALVAQGVAPESITVGTAAPFWAYATQTNSSAALRYEWSFGDQSNPDSHQNACHAYTLTGAYGWQLVVTAGALVTTNTGRILVVAPLPSLTVTRSLDQLVLAWPTNYGGFVLESTDRLGATNAWTSGLDFPVVVGTHNYVTNGVSNATKFYRLRR